MLLRWPTSIRRHKPVQHFADNCLILSTSNLRVKELPFESLGPDSPSIRGPGYVGWGDLYNHVALYGRMTLQPGTIPEADPFSSILVSLRSFLVACGCWHPIVTGQRVGERQPIISAPCSVTFSFFFPAMTAENAVFCLAKTRYSTISPHFTASCVFFPQQSSEVCLWSRRLDHYVPLTTRSYHNAWRFCIHVTYW